MLDNSQLPAPEELSPPSKPARRFSPVVTTFSLLIVLSGIAFLGWFQITIPPLDRVSYPEDALEHLIGRTMDQEYAIAQTGEWEQWLLHVVTAGGNELEQAIIWYRELAARSADPRSEVHLAILQAEYGQLPEVQSRVGQWEQRSEPFPTFARLLRTAYLDPTPNPDEALLLQAELAEALPSGWFYDQLAIRLAQRTGDQPLYSVTEQALSARGGYLLERTRELLTLDLLISGTGIVLALWLFIRRNEPHAIKIGDAALPPDWPGRVGAHVLIRGAAAAILIIMVLVFLQEEALWMRALAMPVVYLPFLILARRNLFRPAGVGFCQALGLCPPPARRSRVILVVPVLMAASLVVEWAVTLAAQSVNLSMHWTEFFIEDLVWGPIPVVAVTLLEVVIFAPILEEILFRGLLFSSLRTKFGWGASAAMSSGIFSIAHGYGLLGMVSVFWSGIVWAWAFEKTQSLLPGIVGHALNNLVFCAAILLLLR